MTWWRRDAPLPSREAVDLASDTKDQLAAAHRLQSQVREVQHEASRTLERNHFAAAITAAIGGKK